MIKYAFLNIETVMKLDGIPMPDGIAQYHNEPVLLKHYFENVIIQFQYKIESCITINKTVLGYLQDFSYI